MGLLILSALLASVSAAPSILGPYPYAAVPAGPWGVAPLLVAPTIPPGDIQAAVINAQVKITDQARIISDVAKDVAEQAVENQNQVIINANDLAKEKSEETFWAAEEKKWQALNQAQIAEAKLANSIANGVASDSGAGDKIEIKSGAQVKSEEKAEVKSAAVEVKSEVKAVEAEMPAVAQMPAEAQMPVEAKAKDTAQAKATSPEAVKPEDAIAALKAALKSIVIAKGLNYQPYISPLAYQVYNSYPLQHIPGLTYQPTIAVKNAW